MTDAERIELARLRKSVWPRLQRAMQRYIELERKDAADPVQPACANHVPLVQPGSGLKVSRDYPAGPITVNNSDGKVTITYTKEGKSYTDTFECKGASSIKVDTVGDKTYVKMVCE